MAATTVYIQICLAFLFTIIVCIHISSADNFINPEVEEGSFDNALKTDKRYAMMSYGYGGGRGRSRNKYDYYGKRYYGFQNNYKSRYPYNYNSYYNYNYNNPWNNLPNRRCYRQRCYSDRQCCKYHNICDRSARICIDCWRGYPCKSSKDCCSRYPKCDSRRGGCAEQ